MRQGNWNPWQRGLSKSLEDRLSDKYVVNPITGCWDWTASKLETGYGQVLHGDGVNQSRPIKAHRAMWEVMNGPLESTEELDHLCRNPGCINPGHLQVVTRKENAVRAGKGLIAWAPQCA